LVGGTMLYFNALQKGLSDLPSADEKVRMRLQQELEKVGLIALHQRLQQIDPKAANSINANDPQRTLRALEIYEMTGEPMSELWLKSPKKMSQYNFVNFAFMPQDRNNLHQIIEKRFQHMLDNGLVEEVERLYRRGDLDADFPSIRSVGYRQIWEYLSGNLSYDEMQQKSIVATRQLAKRQMTWLRQWEFETLSGDFEKDISLISAYLNLLMVK
jgi:tRNA dimethylallyltransferase